MRFEDGTLTCRWELELEPPQPSGLIEQIVGPQSDSASIVMNDDIWNSLKGAELENGIIKSLTGLPVVSWIWVVQSLAWLNLMFGYSWWKFVP